MSYVGNTIKEFNQATVDTLKRDDLFVVSIPDRYSNKIYNSRSIVFDDLLNDIKKDLIKYCEFGSMFNEESSDYSLTNHKHDIPNDYNASDYNYISVSYSQSPTKTDYDKINICNYMINGNISSIYIDRQVIHVPDYTKPRIGDLKFVGYSNLQEIDENTDINGWVYPDGKKRLASKWPEVGNKFGSVVDGKFTVPILSDFIKPMNVDGEKSNVPYSFPLRNHTHRINGSVYGNISVTYELSIGRSGDGGPLFHGHRTNVKKGDAIIADNFSLEIVLSSLTSNLEITPTDILGDPHPTYVNTPVMIYIGRKEG